MPQVVQDIDWFAVAPPLILACTAVVVLLADAFSAARSAVLPFALTLVGITLAALPMVAMWGTTRRTFCVETVPAPALNGPQPCSFAVDQRTLVVWAVVLFGTAVVALLGTAEAATAERRTPLGEWGFLLLCSATGALSIAASRDLITLVVSLEVVSLPAFALVALRRDDPSAAEAAVKFFLVSVISTAITLMGISLVYGVTGTVFLDGINSALVAGRGPQQVAAAAAVLTVVGLGFKVAAVPFHVWVPDTYVGAPVAVAAYLSVVSKAAGFVGLLLVLGVGLASYADVWAPVLAVLAALTMTIGNLLALRQRHAVRLLAWSSVAQSGYILVPFGAAAHSGSMVASGTGASGATLGYLALYAVMNLGAFSVAAVVGVRHPGQRIDDYRGLVREEPGAGWALAFALVALAGLPPAVIGLTAKVVVFQAAAGPVTWLAVVMAVNVAIGLVYYVRWLAELFRSAEAAGSSTYDVPTGVGVAIGMTVTAGVVLSVFPGLVLDRVLGGW